jgi:hypothetical protein
MKGDKAQENNDIYLLPNEVTMKYNISDGYVDYGITEEHIQMLKKFIGDNVRSIENKSKNPSEWKSIEITDKNNFFCSTLCNYRKFCESYKKFVECYKLGETNIL